MKTERTFGYQWYQSFDEFKKQPSYVDKFRLHNVTARVSVEEDKLWYLEFKQGGQDTWACAVVGNVVRFCKVSNPQVLASSEFNSFIELRETGYYVGVC